MEVSEHEDGSRPRRYSADFKRLAVRLVTQGHFSFQGAAKAANVSEQELRSWYNNTNRGHAEFSTGIYVCGRPKRPARERPLRHIPTMQWDVPWPFGEGQHTDLNDSADRFFPTIYFPSEIFQAENSKLAINAWTAYLEKCLSDFSQALKIAESTARGEKSDSTEYQYLHADYDEQDARDILDFLDDRASKEKLSAADLMGLISAAYYLGRLAERQELRQFEINTKNFQKQAAGRSWSHASENSAMRELLTPRVMKHMDAGVTHNKSCEMVCQEIDAIKVGTLKDVPTTLQKNKEGTHYCITPKTVAKHVPDPAKLKPVETDDDGFSDAW